MTLTKEREAEIRSHEIHEMPFCAKCELLAALDECRAERDAALEAAAAAGPFARHISACDNHDGSKFQDLAENWLNKYENVHTKWLDEEIERGQKLIAERDAFLLACRKMMGALEFYADSFAIMDSITGTYEIMERWYSKARGALTSTRKILKDAGVEL